MASLSDNQLKELGFASVGTNVRISEKASLYNTANMHIGNDVRIDDFCILSAGKEGIHIGSHVHIACYAGIIGAGKITLSDFCGISARTMIYSSNDDYSGEWLTGPTLPAEYTNVTSAPVSVGRHSVVGAGCIVLPGTTIGDGVAVGAMSLVKGTLEDNYVYVGVPARKIKEKSRRYKEMEQQYTAAAAAKQGQ